MKKLISILAALAVVTTCSLVGFAAEETTNVVPVPTDEVLSTLPNYVETWDDTEKTYEVDLTTVAGSQEQTTILAVKGNTISVGTIEYIGQSEVPVFNFDLRNTLNAGETVYVLAGGSDIAAQVVGYMAEEATEPELPPVEKITISGTVSGWAGSTLPTVKIYNGEAEVATAEVTASATAGTADFTVVAPKLETGSYTLKATKVGHTSYTKENITAEATVNPVVYGGNTNGDSIINLDDIVKIIGVYETETTDSNYDVSCNLNEDTIINLDDIVVVIGNYENENIVE